MPPLWIARRGESKTLAAARGRGGVGSAPFPSSPDNTAPPCPAGCSAAPASGPGGQLSQLGDEKPADNTPIIRAAPDSGQVDDPAPLSLSREFVTGSQESL